MIHYQLHCGKGHEFDGWFANSSAFDEQRKQGLIACPHCGNLDVQRALMAPAIGRKSNRSEEPVMQSQEGQNSGPASSAPAPPIVLPDSEAAAQVAAMVQKIRSEIETTCDYVGPDFAEEARKIHYGEADARGIYGEATLNEAQELVEEGIEVAALPWAPRNHS